MTTSAKTATTKTAPATPLLLPGQAASPAGPCDLSGMYLMHHAFRRDLRRFTAAVEHTPLDDATTWRALQERWGRMAHHLHEHHSVEDRVLWPLLQERVDAAGDQTGQRVLDAMTAEHADIDPLLERAGDGFRTMADAPLRTVADDLAETLVEAFALLDGHLGHEERDAVALVQRYVGADEWDRLERREFRGRPAIGELRFQLPWMVAGLPDDVVAPLVRAAGPAFRLLLVTSRRAFDKQEAAAFAHVPATA
ncbi:hemerythrin domain-containing protein [Nocardioides sp.]|uniref:hemerythrin domain-containing protein n=1 Tax=Nocardioides sp. TaxID=35761 RepID=UPI002717E90D|nr:hemerythrin domain-containing protein [Nocardioides sp.]MDO9457785.1 hemerythrin domain-containing protein [Nocardioides sp.]